MTIAYPIGYPIASRRVCANRPRIARPAPSHPPVSVVLHSSLTTERAAGPVDNSAAASVAPRLRVECNAFGEIDGGVR